MTPDYSDAPYKARSDARLGTDNLFCCKGQVADITGSGMRMIVSPDDLPEVGDVQEYTFSDGSSELFVTGTVKWVRKGPAFTRRSEVGVEFNKLDPQTRDEMIKLAVQGKLGNRKDASIQIQYPDLYKTIGSNRYASKAELQASFNKEANAWNPNHNNHPKAAQYYEEIQKAFAVLNDADARAKYDLRCFGPEIDPENTFGDHPNNQSNSEAA